MTIHQKMAVLDAPEDYRLTQRDYLLLDGAGVFSGFSKTELIEGRVVVVNAQYSRHARTHSALYLALAQACERSGSNARGWIEVSVDLADDSMPQPDLVVSFDLPEDGPLPLSSLAIVIEIADSSLAFDLKAKVRLYAAAGVPEYWVADVNARVVHRFSDHADMGYRQTARIPFGQSLESATIPDLVVDTTSL